MCIYIYMHGLFARSVAMYVVAVVNVGRYLEFQNVCD